MGISISLHVEGVSMVSKPKYEELEQKVKSKNSGVFG
jgi:hypothetical protein